VAMGQSVAVGRAVAVEWMAICVCACPGLRAGGVPTAVTKGVSCGAFDKT